MLPRLAIAAALGLLSAGCADAIPASLPVVSSAPSPPSSPVEIVPGVAVGPIRLGMTRAEVESLRVLRRHPRYSGMTVPYQVAYDETGRVAFAQVSVLRAPGDVRVDRTLVPRGTSFLRARELLGDCSEPDIGFGGGSFSCRGDRVEVTGGSGSPDEIWIGTHPPR